MGEGRIFDAGDGRRYSWRHVPAHVGGVAFMRDGRSVSIDLIGGKDEATFALPRSADAAATLDVLGFDETCRIPGCPCGGRELPPRG